MTCKATGIRNAKVTHHLTACLQKAGFGGSRPDQIDTLTNHALDKQHLLWHARLSSSAIKSIFMQCAQRIIFLLTGSIEPCPHSSFECNHCTTFCFRNLIETNHSSALLVKLHVCCHCNDDNRCMRRAVHFRL